MITTDTVTDCTANDLTTTTTYDGTTPLGYQITEVLKLCSATNAKKISALTKEACTALGLPLDTKGGNKPPAQNVAIFVWLRDNKQSKQTDLIVLPIVEPVAPAEEIPEAIEPQTTANLFALETENVIVPIGTTAIPVLLDMTLAEAQAKHTELKSIHSIARTMLLEMRDRKGWLALGFESWADYAIKEWGYSENYLNRLANAARIQSVVVPIGTNEIPESHTRELANLPTDDAMREVYDRVIAENEKVTAKAIQDAVAEWKAKHDAIQHDLLTTQNNQAQIIEAKVSAAIAVKQADLLVENSAAIQTLEKQLSDANDKIAQQKKDYEKDVKDGVARGLGAKKNEIDQMNYTVESLEKQTTELREARNLLENENGTVKQYQESIKDIHNAFADIESALYLANESGRIPIELMNQWQALVSRGNQIISRLNNSALSENIIDGAVLVGELVN